MGKTIRVSDEFHSWIKAHKEGGETMEETLRRLTRGPHPSDVAGLLTAEDAEKAKDEVADLRSRDSSRLERARDAFSAETDE